MHELENLDLNRLLALHWLLEDIQVTRAARHLGTSQPALSRTLKDLREWFGDPLLVKQGREMVRSPFAERLRPRLAGAIGELRALARPPGPFDAETARGSIRIACTEYVASMVLGAWTECVSPRAPGLDLELRSWNPSRVDELEGGSLDLAITPSRLRGGESRFARATWLEDRYATLVRHSHALAGRRIGWKRFAALAHVQIVTGLGGTSEIDRAFRTQGLERRVAIRTESFLLAVRALADGDRVATVPSLVKTAASGELAEVRTPLELAPFTLDLIWHPRHSTRDDHAFVRDALRDWSPTAAIRRSR